MVTIENEPKKNKLKIIQSSTCEQHATDYGVNATKLPNRLTKNEMHSMAFKMVTQRSPSFPFNRSVRKRSQKQRRGHAPLQDRK